ncbi:O-fucosyltransferase 13 isoform X1 [Tanacetum coccineum]
MVSILVKKPLLSLTLTTIIILSVLILSSPYYDTSPLSQIRLYYATGGETEEEIWSAKRVLDWRPCKWWLQGHFTDVSYPFLEFQARPALGVGRTIACGLLCSNAAALPAKTNGYIRVDCYGGLNQMRRDVSTLNISHYVMVLVLYFKFGFTDVFDVDYFIQQLKGFIEVVKELPAEIASREPVRVDCSKRKGQFDYVETVLPSLLKHRYISITPAMSQRRDRFPLYGKAALCQACYSALRLTSALEKKSAELLEAIPKPFLALHLRFEPDMVAYSQCEYNGLLPSSMEAIDASRRERKPWTGETARGIPIMELEGLTSVYSNVVTKSSLLSGEDFKTMHGNTKAALDYYVSINSDAYVATYFGNMDKMVAAMRAYKRLYKTLFLSRKAFADFTSQGLKGKELMEALRKAHRDDYVMGRGSALPDCFCDFQL